MYGEERRERKMVKMESRRKFGRNIRSFCDSKNWALAGGLVKEIMVGWNFSYRETFGAFKEVLML